jgi:CBS domain-containing protein
MPAETLLVRDYMTAKAVTSDFSETLYNAAKKMIDSKIGCIVITKDGDVAGILTKGDILKNLLLKLGDPQKISVDSVISKPVICIAPDKSLEQAAKIMAQENVSKLPVISEGVLTGIITSTDIIRIEPSYVKYLKDLIGSKSAPGIQKISVTPKVSRAL